MTKPDWYWWISGWRAVIGVGAIVTSIVVSSVGLGQSIQGYINRQQSTQDKVNSVANTTLSNRNSIKKNEGRIESLDDQQSQIQRKQQELLERIEKLTNDFSRHTERAGLFWCSRDDLSEREFQKLGCHEITDQ